MMKAAIVGESTASSPGQLISTASSSPASQLAPLSQTSTDQTPGPQTCEYDADNDKAGEVAAADKMDRARLLSILDSKGSGEQGATAADPATRPSSNTRDAPQQQHSGDGDTEADVCIRNVAASTTISPEPSMTGATFVDVSVAFSSRQLVHDASPSPASQPAPSSQTSIDQSTADDDAEEVAAADKIERAWHLWKLSMGYGEQGATVADQTADGSVAASPSRADTQADDCARDAAAVAAVAAVEEEERSNKRRRL